MDHIRIVQARPPARIPRPPHAAAPPPAPEPGRPASAPSRAEAPGGPGLPHLTPDAARRAFRKLAAAWRLPEDLAWAMLAGHPAAPRRMTEDAARRVASLMEMEAVMKDVVADVGAWMTQPNPGPLLAGRSPLDFLTRTGTPGYVALLRQARRWAQM